MGFETFKVDISIIISDKLHRQQNYNFLKDVQNCYDFNFTILRVFNYSFLNITCLFDCKEVLYRLPFCFALVKIL